MSVKDNPPTNLGAVKLAGWLDDFSGTNSNIPEWAYLPFSRHLLCRLARGDVLPDPDVAQWVRRVTGYRVLPGDWTAPVPQPPGNQMTCTIDGPIGTLPQGPVWRAIVAEERDRFVLAGPGVALVLDRFTAKAMLAVLSTAIEEMERE